MKSWQFIQSQMSENNAKDLWWINTSQLSCFYVLGFVIYKLRVSTNVVQGYRLIVVIYGATLMLHCQGKDSTKTFLWKGLLDVITTCPWSIFLCSCICLTGENLPDHLTSLCIVWFLLSENIFNSTSVFEWTCVVHELFEKHFFEHISDYNHL